MAVRGQGCECLQVPDAVVSWGLHVAMRQTKAAAQYCFAQCKRKVLPRHKARPLS
jgi:hypothetical protein